MNRKRISEIGLKKGWAAPCCSCGRTTMLPYREQIVYACTHNMAFDRQTESR